MIIMFPLFQNLDLISVPCMVCTSIIPLSIIMVEYNLHSVLIMVEVIYLNFVSKILMNMFLWRIMWLLVSDRFCVWIILTCFFNLRIFLYYENNTCLLGEKLEVQISKKKKMKSLTAKPSLTLRHFTPQVLFWAC